MANQSASLDFATGAGPPLGEAVPVAHDPRLQRLVDQAAGFNLFAIPQRESGGAIPAPGGGAIGLQLSEALHRFDIDLGLAPVGTDVQASNRVGERVGQLDLRWLIIPQDFRALPDREPPPTLLDRSRSQRFTMQETAFAFGDGRSGFRSFGTGRTFPVALRGQPKLLVAAVGNLTKGFGKFQSHEGNFTLCGEITPDHGFLGHLIVRVQDPQGILRTQADLAPLQHELDPDPEFTYLLFAGQKGRGPDQVNRFSFGPNGQMRALNVSTELKHLRMGCAVSGPEGFLARDFQVGEVIGREIGAGRGSEPGADPSGSALRPFLFEGVARYSLNDSRDREVGALTTNVLEGRRFDMRLPEDPQDVAWRFGFFGPVVLGSGCFSGAQGMFYGASASIFRPPPGAHMITHFYAARLHDPHGRFRAARGRL